MKRWITAAIAALAPAVALMAEPAPTPDVDLFPSQSWNSLKDRTPAQPPSADVPSLEDALAAAPPADRVDSAPVFEPIGEWVDAGRRIVVLSHQGEAHLLCQRCDLDGAVRPGGAVTPQYRFRALEPKRVVLVDAQGRQVVVDLSPLAQ
ncbi:MAG: hypothetical protein E2591_11600 [Achromobacter sp.]|uniref:hypothetical protein n=1 Tax=Achromobacter sp. TaxID=134375 RepID=UPI0012CE3D58|nr:hypothetical protein [Achromobacter sp.]MPS78709.1 hypothetical protein [Achromobacter sp.]